MVNRKISSVGHIYHSLTHQLDGDPSGRRRDEGFARRGIESFRLNLQIYPRGWVQRQGTKGGDLPVEERRSHGFARRNGL